MTSSISIYNSNTSLVVQGGVNSSQLFTINPFGVVQVPYQPSFKAVLNQTRTIHNANILANHVLYNTGGHYDESKGKFRAPVDGVYQFECKVTLSDYNPTERPKLRIQADNERYISYLPIFNLLQDNITFSAIESVFMKAYTIAQCILTSSSPAATLVGTATNTTPFEIYTSFSGRLIG